jgi:beta-phosphoglucomutase-like phosphatase (HAD superfamily)
LSAPIVGIDSMKPTVISFDCYGTLIDWESGILAYFRALADTHAISIADEALFQQRGPTLSRPVSLVIKGSGSTHSVGTLGIVSHPAVERGGCAF